MPKGPKGFSDMEKAKLRKRLCEACERSWSVHGYKKTTVAELTKSIGVATGSFYLLFSSKEELFYEAFIQVQERLRSSWRQMIDQDPTKEGFKKAMKWLYREYSQSPFLYDFANPDFFALLNKLPEDQQLSLKDSSFSFFEYSTKLTGLRLSIPQEKAFAVLSTLLYTVSFADKTVYDHFEIYEFLLDSTIDKIFV